MPFKRHLNNQFNLILTTGKYHIRWSFGLIVPRCKKDDQYKVKNYRATITCTLLSVLGKHFTSILDNRKKKAQQGGFRKMHGTVDCILILKN